MRRVTGPAAFCALALLFPACREVARELASGPAGTAAADDLVVALATRFGPIERGPRFDAARPKLTRAALVPSRVFEDVDLWTSRESRERELAFFGRREGESYHLEVEPSPPAPVAPGDYRGRLHLRRVDDGRYEWTVGQELAVGSLRPGDVSDALTALLRSAEILTPSEARTRATEAFPRAAAAFSRLYDLETLELERKGPVTAVHLALRLRPNRLRSIAPRYAAFLEKTTKPMEAEATLCDASGATWWRIQLDELRWSIRFRVRDGSLVPLQGPEGLRLPARLQLTVDASTKKSLFTIGVRGLVADVTLIRTPREKGYTAEFRAPPEWRLPFFVKPFLSGSLHYPFQGPGSSSSFTLKLSPGGGSELSRHHRIRVRETWIFRWMGGLGSSVMGDFRKGAESESDRFNRECLLALREDVLMLLADDGAGVRASGPRPRLTLDEDPPDPGPRRSSSRSR
jgi:hypothetical protein